MGNFNNTDSYLFHQGTSYEVYKKMGAHIATENGVRGTHFTVWAPNAQSVSVISDATGWENEHPMERTAEGIWETFVRTRRRKALQERSLFLPLSASSRERLCRLFAARL